jgi:1-deoxy-D-xylulose-5-phosphate reductoisomerase
MIEAHWLFGLQSQRIRILVHPQSVVHSMVTFIDGSMKAQLGITDMRLPIQYALSWPRRLPGHLAGLDLCQYPGLTFQPPDNENFRNLAIAMRPLTGGGTMPCVMNAANEMAVKAFLKKGIRFTDIPLITLAVMESAAFEQNPDLNCLLEADHEARFRAMEIINKKEK